MSMVLILDEEELVVQTTRAILAWAGHTVLNASTPEEAMQIARQHQIELLLIDSFYDLRRRGMVESIADLNPAMKILRMSTLPEAGVRWTGSSCDPTRCIAKPFTSRELLAAVEKVLQENARGAVSGRMERPTEIAVELT